MRIEPKNPIPKIDFIQWDGLLRICFSRKNKLLVAIFKKKVILNLLFKNHMRAKEMLQMGNAGPLKDFSMLGKEESSTVNISKKKKKKRTRKQKRDEIRVEGIIEEKMDDLEIEDSDVEEQVKGASKAEPNTHNKEEVEKFKAQLMGVMTTNGFEKERASKMHWSRFLELLQILNANQVYFR